MSPIFWTPTARQDLRAAHDYVARDSRVYARRLVDKIRKAVLRLKRFPLSGAMVPEWQREDLREIPVGNYRVIYRPRPNRIEILNVLHAARTLPPPPFQNE